MLKCIRLRSGAVCRDQHKMDEHVANVQDFHAMMSAHSDWIHNTEQTVASFKHPSKLVERVLQQINEHKVPSYSTHSCPAAFLLACATST